jgi:dUTP pyrophosphatase
MTMDQIKLLLWSIFPHAEVYTYDGPKFIIPEYKLVLYMYNVSLADIQDDGWRHIRISDEAINGGLESIRSYILSHLNKLEVKRTENGVGILEPRLDGDAGWDILTSEDTVCQPGAGTDIPSDLMLAMPDHLYAIVQARSSTSKRGLLVLPGVIDPGYRGRIWVMAYNLSKEPVYVKKGARLGQLLFFHRVNHLHIDIVDKLRSSERQERGFGSSGL